MSFREELKARAMGIGRDIKESTGGIKRFKPTRKVAARYLTSINSAHFAKVGRKELKRLTPPKKKKKKGRYKYVLVKQRVKRKRKK